MTKKHLSDLIKGQINPENQPNPPQTEKTEVKPSKPSPSRITKAHLETQVKQLTDELATAQKAIEPLQAKVGELEASIKEKNAQIQALEADLSNQQKTEPILLIKEAELRKKQEKIDILTHQLQDYQDLSSQLTEKEQLIETLYRKLQDAEKIQEKSGSLPEKSAQLPVKKAHLAPIPRYVAPTKSETLSDDDIGWFD